MELFMSLIKRFFSSRNLGIFISFIQLATSLLLLGLTFNLNILPNNYLLVLIIILSLFWIIALLTQIFKKPRTAGKIFSILICVALGFGCYYINTINNMIDLISDKKTKVDDISIIVLKDDPAQSLSDAKDYKFGIQKTIDKDNVNKAINNFNERLNQNINIVAYDGFYLQINALYNQDVKVIILNEAYRDTIDDVFPGFSEKTRILDSYKIVTDVALPSANKKVTQNPFAVYISGIDTYGPVSRTSRSDVNIIAVINPKTKQILLQTTPRDYYVLLPNVNAMDKLTHAGNFGIDASMATLKNLYDIEMDYYIRVNFTSLIGLVDELGGITVNSEYAFTARGGKHHFNVGENKMNGEEALAFSRERFSFATGDNQRGINQTQVIKGIFNKACSPAILKNYSNIIDKISGSFETNMSSDEVKGLVKMQMGDNASWNMVSNAAAGTGSYETTYSMGSRKLSVIIPDNSSIEKAKNKIKQVINGETLDSTLK
ncbi:MAG: LCP family protein [Oscillospiraceae bacterium]|nr:LCP family protein [Oscillospiraceae bacterium]